MEIEYKKLITIPGFEPFEKWDMEPNPFRQFRCKALRGDEPNWFVSSLILANTPIGSIENQHLGGAAGSSIYLEDSYTSCVCEGFERYCSMNYFMKDTPYMRISLQWYRCSG